MEVRDNKLFVVESKIQTSKRKLVKIYLLFKLIENNLEKEFSDGELDILVNLYIFGGVSDREMFKSFLNNSYKLGLSKKGSNSIRNLFGKARIHGILIRKSSSNWQFNKKYISDDMYSHPYFVFRGSLTNLGHAEQQ